MGGRLHPAVAAVRGAVRDSCADLEPGSTVLVACSGGADSLALADAAVFVGSRAGWLVGGVVVDHGLQEGSAAQAARAAGQLRRLGCDPVDVVAVEVGSDGGPEAAARAARHAALEALAAQHDAAVLLGHTRDDQAESVLLGLARGSGTRSLAGMPARRGPFIRPLLGVTRETTREACRAARLAYWDDPHNDDLRHARVRVRRDALPALEAALGPGVAAALARTADLARADADLLDALAAELAAAAARAGGLDVAALAAAPTPLRGRVLRAAAIRAGSPAAELAASHVAQLDRLITDWRGQAGVDLPGPVTAHRRRVDGAAVLVFARLDRDVSG